MKKSFLFILFALTINMLFAQTVVPVDNSNPQKFSDLLAQYKQYKAENDDDISTNEKEPGEGMDLLFNRRIWQAKRHIDENGYIVPALQSINEWTQYNAKRSLKTSRTTATPSNWTFGGPDNSTTFASCLGRVNLVAFDPVDSNTFYVGSAAGGTWKTTDGGKTYTCLYNFLPSIGVADIKINPHNRNTVYVSTGDGDGFDAFGAGVIVSHDGGTTWTNTSLNWPPNIFQKAFSMLIDPLDTTSMLVAATTGIYKTNNSGTTWTKVDTRICKQILYNPADTAIIYGATMNNSDEWFSTEAQIIRSTDGGFTWDSVTTFTNTDRISLAVTPANPGIVKALVCNPARGLNGIYTSLDAGATFFATYVDDFTCTQNLLGWVGTLPTPSCGGQGPYDLCIAIDPNNINNVMIGGVNTWASTDGGISWAIADGTGLITTPYVHLDKHFLGWHPLTHALFETNDGGVDKTYFPLTGPWIDLTNGLGITEFYNNAVNNTLPYTLGGAQDNGSMMLNAGVLTFLTGGDGFQTYFNYGDPAHIFYTSYAYGDVSMTRDGGTTYHSISQVIGDPGTFVTPYMPHPHDTATLILAYKNVFVSHDNGNSWAAISPVFNTSYYISLLKMSAKNPNYIYAAYDDYYVTGKSIIQYTTDFGSTWNPISFPYVGSYITYMAVDPMNEKHFWVTVGGSVGGTKVFSYDLAAGTWINESGTLPNIPINCILIDTSTQTRYIGTETSIFYKTTAMTDWALYNTNLPNVQVEEMNINYTTNEIWAATFGRGMWKSAKNDTATHPISHVYTPATTLPSGTVTISPNPTHGSVTINTTSADLRNSDVSVKLVTADGKTVWNNEARFDNAGNIKIPTNNLPMGFYICEVKSDNITARNKVVIY